jgi:hypothetical protein
MMIDRIFCCVYCGSVQEDLTKEQMKIFGRPNCCDYDMVPLDRNKMLVIVKALDKLKKNIEEEILKGMM